MQLVLEQSLPQRLLHFALSRMCVLPPIETDETDDFVDVVDDSQAQSNPAPHLLQNFCGVIRFSGWHTFPHARQTRVR